MDPNTHSRIWLNIYEIFKHFGGSWTQDHGSHFMDPNTHSHIWLNIFEILRRSDGSWTQYHGSLDLGSHFMDPVRAIVFR